MSAGVMIGMRLFAEEKELGTLELLSATPINDAQLALGKYISAVLLLALLIISALPVPLSVLIFGDGHWGHVFAGCTGVFLLGSSAVAITIFYSTLTNIQILAGVMAAANIVVFLLLGFFSPYIGEPLKSIVREFSLYVHHMDFEQGVIVLKHVLFYISIDIFYLTLTVVSLGSKRWK